MLVRKAAAFLLRTFIYFGGAFIAFEIACWLHPPVLAWGLAAIGRAEICSSSDVYRGTAYRVRESKMSEHLTAQSQLDRRDGELALWKTPEGNWWIPGGGEKVLPALLAQQRSGLYDSKSFNGKVVLDCGAHIGLYSREALEAGAETVVAIEPSPDNVACLRRNVEIMKSAESGSGNVIVYPKGVWDEEKTLKLYHTPQNSAGDSFVAQAQGDQVIEQIPVTTIDRLAAELKLPQVNLIKMDIKGATVRALNGASAVVAKYHPRFVISTEEREDSKTEIIAWMAAHGYRPRCGACTVSATYEVSPTVLYFE